jgi:hypothetical protein
MPEALAVLVVLAVCLVVYVAAWLRSRDPSFINVEEDLQRLRHHEAWLRERLLRAVEERWDAEMIAGIADELHVTALQLARFKASTNRR